MNIKQYQYVSTLAHELNFTRSAEILGITQPTLSQFIKKIEREIGTELFSRNGSDVRLLEAGQVFLQYGQKLLAMQHAMSDELLNIAEFKKGELRIALSPCRCDTMMPQIVKKFRERYPGIKVSISEVLAGTLLKGIDGDDFTLGVTPKPQDTFNYICEKVIQEEIILAVPKGSAVDCTLSKQANSMENRLYPAVDFSLLDGANFIVMQEWQIMQKQLETLCADCAARVVSVVECTNNRTMIPMVQNGIGCALLPSSILGESERRRFDKISLYSLKQDVPLREIVAIYRKNKKLNEPARYMLDLITERRN